MKILTIDGRVGANGTEIKTTKNGKPYARFSIANNVYSNGETKTEWYDVICYDPSFIEKRAQYCGKGCYVIVSGDIRTEVKVDQSNKVWVNHYITANTVDTPRFSTKNENTTQATVSSGPAMSTFTGGTKSEFVASVNVNPNPNVTVQAVGATVGAGAINYAVDDDLPF